MQQLETSKQIVEEAEQKYKRECKGRCLALTRKVYRLMQTDVFYVESESTKNVYYFVKFKPDVMEFCSCKDYESNRAQKCKHLYSIEFAIRMGTLKDTDKLPEDAKRKAAARQSTTVTKKSFIEDDDYSF